jgi:uncharacterized protein (TIGR03435 family)
MRLLLIAAAALTMSAQTSEVQISPSTLKDVNESVDMRPNSLTARGFTLKQIIAWVSKVSASRVIIPRSLDSPQRYDFSLATPGPEDDAALDRRIAQAVGSRFQVAITREIRPQDVYVMTTRPSPALKPAPASPSTAISSGVTITTTSISAENASIEDISQMLEQHLHAIVVDESGLKGRYQFEIKSIPRGDEAFLGALRDNLGLDLTRARRDIEMIIVTAR